MKKRERREGGEMNTKKKEVEIIQGGRERNINTT